MIRTCPPSMSEHLAVVPPMSSASTFGSPMSRPSSAAPQKPLAGPDSIIVIGISRVFSTERSEEHTSELQSHSDLVCRLLLEKKKQTKQPDMSLIVPLIVPRNVCSSIS